MLRPKIFLLFTLGLFVFIGLLGWMKKGKDKTQFTVNESPMQEIAFTAQNNVTPAAPIESLEAKANVKASKKISKADKMAKEDLPDANYIDSFFDPAAMKLPIVETVTYSSRVSWLKGKPAWVSDYSSYFKTSKHFIARSLNRSLDYFSQNVKNGDRFNVLRTDKDFYFYLVVDVSRCKMWFYYVDNDTSERILIKTYPVGLGRLDDKKASGFLTPIGKYSLGEKIAVYRPGVMGYYNNQPVEMVKVFGTRWIPFESEIGQCTAPAKGLGIHGAPLTYDNSSASWKEEVTSGNHSSDGCLRLEKNDMEELFAIIVSRPTVVELVKDFHLAKLPGNEKKMD